MEENLAKIVESVKDSDMLKESVAEHFKSLGLELLDISVEDLEPLCIREYIFHEGLITSAMVKVWVKNRSGGVLTVKSRVIFEIRYNIQTKKVASIIVEESEIQALLTNTKVYVVWYYPSRNEDKCECPQFLGVFATGDAALISILKSELESAEFATDITLDRYEISEIPLKDEYDFDKVLDEFLETLSKLCKDDVDSQHIKCQIQKLQWLASKAKAKVDPVEIKKRLVISFL